MESDLYDWLTRLVEEGANHPKANEWERGFLKDLAERMNQYQTSTRFSEKQWQVLDKFADKIDFEPRPVAEPC